MQNTFIPEVKSEYIYSLSEDIVQYFIASIYRYWVLIYHKRDDINYEQAEDLINGSIDNFGRYTFIIKIIIPFNLINKNVNEEDNINLENYMRKDLTTDFKYIFRGSLGYYILYPESIDIINYYINPNEIMYNITMSYDLFNSYESTIKYITDKKCIMMYKDYKYVCGDVWNTERDPTLSNEEIVDKINSIDECLDGRLKVYKQCDRFHDEKHKGAIIKLEKLKHYFNSLMIDRFNRKVELLCPVFFNIPYNTEGLKVNQLRQYIEILEDCDIQLNQDIVRRDLKYQLNLSEYNGIIRMIRKKISIYKSKLQRLL